MKQKQTTPAEETEDKRPNETPDEESSDGEPSDGESSDGLKEAGESMLSHLMALRKVLLISAAAVLIGFVLVFYLAIDPLMAQILAPIQARGIQVIFTTMSEALVTKFKVALLAGMIIASPVVIWEIWGFIKPALYPQEKRKFRLLFVLALLLFLTGVGSAISPCILWRWISSSLRAIRWRRRCCPLTSTSASCSASLCRSGLRSSCRWCCT